MASLPDPTTSLSGEALKVYQDIAARRSAKGVHHLGPYVPLLNDPELAKRIEHLGYYYKYMATLPRDVYQFIVLVFAKHCGSKQILLALPPGRKRSSSSLKARAARSRTIKPSWIAACQLPDPVRRSGLPDIPCPQEWK